MNTFGRIFRLTTFGESHGPALGGIIDGMPAGMEVDFDMVQQELDRRRPGQSAIVTARNEADRVEFLSGIFEGRTTGCPIGFIIRNSDQHSNDYEEMRHKFRPSHADFTYNAKFGHRDHRGGGRASARETASRVVGGAIARQALQSYGITIRAYTSRVGDISVDTPYYALDLDRVYSNDVRCPDESAAARMTELIKRVKAEGDTIGGVVTGVIKGVGPGLGSPLFGKLQSLLAGAMLSIPAAKGFDYGLGFEDCGRRGSEMIDSFAVMADGSVGTLSNHSGGIQGGISNGEDIYFRVAFKPVATLLKEVTTVTDSGEDATLTARGRHDPCVLPRAVPVVEAMAAMTVFDAMLCDRSSRL